MEVLHQLKRLCSSFERPASKADLLSQLYLCSVIFKNASDVNRTSLKSVLIHNASIVAFITSLITWAQKCFTYQIKGEFPVYLNFTVSNTYLI